VQKPKTFTSYPSTGVASKLSIAGAFICIVIVLVIVCYTAINGVQKLATKSEEYSQAIALKNDTLAILRAEQKEILMLISISEKNQKPLPDGKTINAHYKSLSDSLAYAKFKLRWGMEK
jgi:hypothetical protein